MRKIRVLVVDDSAFMRKALCRMLDSDPMIQVVDTAMDGQDGYEKVVALKPDVVTLDVKMPGMDGLTALKKIMDDCPVPVLMLSSLTTEGGGVTLRALDLGALDFIDKSSAHSAMDILSIAGDLISKIKTIAGIDVERIIKSRARYVPPADRPAAQERKIVKRSPIEVVVIGASTGGPPALQQILTEMPKETPAGILVVQHMPKGFTASLADRLDGLCKIAVSEAVDGDRVEPGRCLVAPAGLHMTLARGKDTMIVRVSEEPDGLLHRPSVDVLMESVAKRCGSRALGVLLTGMGSDGAAGMKAMRDAKGRTIGQDEKTCVVYGMPRVAFEMGGVETQLPLDKVASAILSELGVE
jgi:two-component system chemotaxis response regulator CheB